MNGRSDKPYGKGKMLLSYLHYRLFAPHRKGHDVHSPFMYEMVREVFSRQKPDELARNISDWHRALGNERKVLITDNPEGQHTKKEKAQVLKNRISVRPGYGHVLYRISKKYRPSTIVELGTGLGISTAYLAAGNPGATVYTIEGNRSRHEFAKRVLGELFQERVRCIHSDFDDWLLKFENPGHPLLVYIDGNHSYDATMRYFLHFARFAREDTIMIFDDIHWSPGMEKAWKDILRWPELSLSVNIFFMGVVLFRKGIARQDFLVNY